MIETIFETPRVLVREWSLQDIDSCFLLVANPIVGWVEARNPTIKRFCWVSRFVLPNLPSLLLVFIK
jgi:hypothetical protein